MINIDKGICYIVAACKDDSDNIYLKPEKNDIVIAADGGYDILKQKCVEADILLGDFDSIEKLPKHKNIVKHPAQKDDTDTFLAYKLALEKGYKNFVIFGGIGGRIDHTIANIQTLSNIARNGGRGFLVGSGAVITSISNSKINFPNTYTGNISIFTQGKDAENVTIAGLKYCVDKVLLKHDTPLGVSNEFIGERAEVSVQNGTLLIIWYEKTGSFLDNISNFLI